VAHVFQRPCQTLDFLLRPPTGPCFDRSLVRGPTRRLAAKTPASGRRPTECARPRFGFPQAKRVLVCYPDNAHISLRTWPFRADEVTFDRSRPEQLDARSSVLGRFDQVGRQGAAGLPSNDRRTFFNAPAKLSTFYCDRRPARPSTSRSFEGQLGVWPPRGRRADVGRPSARRRDLASHKPNEFWSAIPTTLISRCVLGRFEPTRSRSIARDLNNSMLGPRPPEVRLSDARSRLPLPKRR